MLVGVLALVILGLGALSFATARVWRALGAASGTLSQDQVIADEIGQAVMRQLVALTSVWSRPGGGVPESFKAAASDAYAGLQRFLSSPLTAQEREQLQAIKEEEEHLEVDAARLGMLVGQGKGVEARRSNDEALMSASRLRADMASFLRMREDDLEALRARQSEALNRMYVAAPILLLVLLLGVAAVESFFEKRIARPLAESASAADRVAAGDLDVRVPEGRYREFATLSNAFNRMTGGLRSLTTELRERNRELADALDQVQAAQNELLRSEKMNALGRMTAAVAHELNNPLTAVLGYTELLSVRLAGDETLHAGEIREFVQPVLEEARRSHDLVRSLLRFSRRSASDLEPVNLRDALNVAVELKRFLFQQSGLGLEVREVPDCWVMAEEQRLQEVFVNLIDNALDAMKPAGSGGLLIEAAEDEKTLTLRFQDDGPGFDHAILAFEPFYTTKPPGVGTGLGLALVHQFMEEFGGSARAENRPEGGALLTLRLRKTRAPEASGGTGPLPPPPTPRGRRILVVEDEPHLLELEGRILRQAGAEPLLASSVAEARAILNDEDVDAVVSDVKMPGEGGIDLYHWLLAERPDLGDHFLFVTGDTEAPEVAALAEEQPGLVARKPFEVQEYLQRVGAILGAPRAPAAAADAPESPPAPAPASAEPPWQPHSAALRDMLRVIGGRQGIDAELRLQTVFFEELFDGAPEPIVLLGPDGRILRINEELEKLFGLVNADCVGLDIDELVMPEGQHDVGKELTRTVDAGARVETEGVRKRSDGTLVDVAILAKPIRFEGHQVGTYVTYREIAAGPS